MAGAVLCAAALGSSHPASLQTSTRTPLVVYTEYGPWAGTQVRLNGQTFTPLTGLVRHLALPYTDASAPGTITIRGPLATVVATDGSSTIQIGEETVDLGVAPFKEDGEWFVPVEFITSALEWATGIDFRYERGSPRIFAGGIEATPLEMLATSRDGETRLTLRSRSSLNVRVQRARDQNRVVLAIEGLPIDPAQETLGYRDASIRSVRFDDSDGQSKVIVDTTSQVASIRLTPTDENRTFFVDFVPATAPTEAPVARRPSSDSDARESSGSVQVIVIDPGHGGLDGGTRAEGTLEKELTLSLARLIRARLQAELDATVILTRDADLALTGEDRSAIANHARADLLISLHVGYSPDPTESAASLFLVKEIGSQNANLPNPPPNPLFEPWFEAHKPNVAESRRLVEVLGRRLSAAVPGWSFPIREAPINILTSAAMPAVLVELGNANNMGNMRALTDVGFQVRIVDAIVASVEEFGKDVDSVLIGGQQ